MAEVGRVLVPWVIHADAALANLSDVRTPAVYVRPKGAPRHLATRAYLVPDAMHVTLPLRVAQRIRDLEPHDDDADAGPPVFVFPDPLLSYAAPLRRLAGKTHPLDVFGAGDDFLRVRVPVVIDASGKLPAVILGAPFFRQVRCYLDPGLDSSIAKV